MMQRPQLGKAKLPAANGRKPWTTPTVQKIMAGEAEIGTRSTPDGAFTTS